MSSSEHKGTRPKENGDSLGPGRPDPRGPVGSRPDPLPFATRLQQQAQQALARAPGRITPAAPLPARPTELRVRLVTPQGAEVAEHVLPPFNVPPMVLVWGSRVFVHRGDIGLVYEEAFAFFVP